MLKAARTQPFVSANPPKETVRVFPGRFAFDAATVIVVEHHHKQFGGIHAVNDVSLTVAQGTITGLIGPNGAGKTTLFNVITGVYPPTAGHIYLENEEITGLKPHQLFAKGLLRTFQIAHEFATLTVQENLMVVPANQPGERLIDTWLRPRTVHDQELAIRKQADEVIDFLELTSVANEFAGNLSGGQKKLLELGRAMMGQAKIVFLDEVGAGVNRTLLNRIADAILRLNQEQGYTFCMIEHDMEFISKLCDPVIVMDEGGVLTRGSAQEVMANDSVIESYLGAGRKTRNTHQ